MSPLPKSITFLYLCLFLVTPLVFTSFNSELFELPKMYFIYFLTILIVCNHLYFWSTKRSPLFRSSYLDIPLLLFLLSQIISTIISVDRHTSIFGFYSRLNGGLLSTISYLSLYFVLNVYLTTEFKKRLISISLLSAFIVSFYGVLEHFGIDKKYWVQDVQARVFSTFGQPNWLAAYLCLLLPFAIDYLLTAKTSFKKLLFLFLSSNFYLCLIFTKSKTGFIAAAISLSIYFFLKFIKKQLSFNPYLIALGLIFLFSTILVDNPIKNLLFPSSVSTPATPNSTIIITPSEDIRKIVWQGTLAIWQKYPIFGTGVETFAFSYYWTRPASHNLTSEWDFLYNKAHNEYLNYLATTGAFGLISYSAIIFVFLITALIQLFRRSDHEPSIPAIVAGFIAILITNFTGFSVVVTSLYFFILPLFIQPLNSPIPIKNPPVFHLFKFFLFLFIFIYIAKYPARYYLADVFYLESQNIEDQKNSLLEAYQLNQSALNFRPDEPNYLIRQADLAARIAVSFHSQNNNLEANNYAKVALANLDLANRLSPADINLLKLASQSYYYLATADKQYYPMAIDTLQKARLLAPTDAKIPYILGKFYQAASLDQKAIASYQDAVNLKSNYDYALFDLGVLYFNQKNYPAAKTNFQEVLKYAPGNTEAQDYLTKIKALP